MTSEHTPAKPTEILNIYQRMHAVMSTVKYVQKEDKKVNGQYKFVSHDAVTAAIRPALVDNGIATLTRIINHTQDGNRTIVDIEIDFVNIDMPEDRITVPAFGYGVDQQDKGPGKAISYAFKYALLKSFALETGDDPERDSIDHTPEYISEDQILNIYSMIDENNLQKDRFLKWLKTSVKANSIEEIQKKAFNDVVNKINQTIQKRSA